MRYPIIIATGLVFASIAYKYYAKSIVPSPKTIFSWGFVLMILGVLSNTPISKYTDLFIYLIIVIITLNDGYDILKGI